MELGFVKMLSDCKIGLCVRSTQRPRARNTRK